jgi:hypothetical protein
VQVVILCNEEPHSVKAFRNMGSPKASVITVNL